MGRIDFPNGAMVLWCYYSAKIKKHYLLTLRQQIGNDSSECLHTSRFFRTLALLKGDSFQRAKT